MAIKSTYQANNVLDSALTTVFLTLYLNDPTPDNTGLEAGVTRQSVGFDPAVSGSVINNTQVVFANVPTDTFTHWAIFDSATGGNMIYFGQFSQPIIFNESGGELRFEVSDISLTES